MNLQYEEEKKLYLELSRNKPLIQIQCNMSILEFKVGSLVYMTTKYRKVSKTWGLKL